MEAYNPLRPRECGIMNTDLECDGCGAKINCLKPGECPGIEEAERAIREKEAKERQQLAYLKAKYEGK